MNITGRYWKSEDGLAWLIEIPFLDAATQAFSREEIPLMTQDLIEGLMNDPEFAVTVTDMPGGLLIQTNKPKQLVSLILRRQRQKRRLKLEDIAKHLDAKSLNEYAQYEQGKHMPSIEKLEQLLEAIDPQLSPYMSFLKSK